MLTVLQDPEREPQEHEYYLTGMTLEGAEYDKANNILLELPTRVRSSSFPGISVQTTRVQEHSWEDHSSARDARASLGVPTLGPSRLSAGPHSGLDSFPGQPPRSRLSNEGKQSKLSRLSKGSPRAEKQAALYRCPIYDTELRLSRGSASKRAVPVASVDLPTHDSPSKWIKGAVALILED